MKKEMTIRELKKSVSVMDRKDLEKLVCDIYKTCDTAKEMINSKLMGSEYEQILLEQYKSYLHKMFFPKNIGYTDFSIARKKAVLSEFKKVCNNAKYIIDLQLYYVECCVEFTNEFGDIDGPFYNSLCSVYRNVINSLIKQDSADMFREFDERLKSALKNTKDIGWGVYDEMYEDYCCIPRLD